MYLLIIACLYIMYFTSWHKTLKQDRQASHSTVASDVCNPDRLYLVGDVWTDAVLGSEVYES